VLVEGFSTTYDLCLSALRDGKTLEAFVEPTISAKTPVDYQAALDSGRVLAPIDHPDPAHANVTGTGLTHLGSAAGRDKMHSGGEDKTAEENLTDSMKMFNMGLEGGKPESGFGVQPEWFYKGDGSVIVKPGGSFLSPKFALDGSEEPECVGLYVVSDEGVPVVREHIILLLPSLFSCAAFYLTRWRACCAQRVGYALGNEFSDHVMERQNYLYLAHSKLRNCSFGPELLVGDLPGDVQGMSRIYRDGKLLWEKEFVSGEDNMSHFIGNLEHHHFKYKQ